MKKSRLPEAKYILNQNNNKIVILQGEDILQSDSEGISALIEVLNSHRLFMEDASVADKVVGKAAALLMVFGNIKEVYTEVISKPALDCLEKYDVLVEYDQCVERIENKEKKGLCPMEDLCVDTENPVEAFRILNERLKTKK